MDSRIRYEALPTDDVAEEAAESVGASAALDEAAEEPAEVHTPAPATVTETDETATAADTSENEGAGATVPLMPQPPPYNIAVDLPTYEQAEQTKAEEEERAQLRAREERSVGTFFNRLMSGTQEEGDAQLGTDGMFLCTFLMAFVFNWIGLLTSLCVTQTVAGRLGAMSGFGLSLVKWVAIVKHSNWADGVATGDSLLWWLLILMGFLIFFRGSTQYIRIKYHWHRLNQHTRNNIFYYF